MTPGTAAYGPNHSQVEEFLRRARSLRRDQVPEILTVADEEARREPRYSVAGGGLPASARSAVESERRLLVSELREQFGPTSSTAEKFEVNRFMTDLAAAVYALAGREKFGDDVVGLVVDPFTDVLDFDWRAS